MKLFSNKKYNTIAMYVLLIVAVSVVIILCLFRFDGLMRFFSRITSACMPIIVGFIIAYALNPLMCFIEKYLKRWLCKKKMRAKLCRVISIILTMVIFLAAVLGLIAVIAPEIARSLTNIIDNIPGALTKVQNWATNVLEGYPDILNAVKSEIEDFTDYFDSFKDEIQPLLKDILDGVLIGVKGTFSYLYNFLIGLIVCVYLLLGKEKMLAQMKKIFMANMKRSSCERLFDISRSSNRIFSGFITGKVIDSLIIGILCFIGVTILDMPYKLIISVVVGVTNIIPFFGPFIGAIPSAFLVLIAEPKKVIWFILFIFLLQQLDGNVIGPRILGDSTGLPAFWVLFSIVVAGELFGFMGMLLGVPTFAVFYNLFKNHINNKLKLKRLSTVTDDYATGNVMQMYKRPPHPSDYLTEEEISIMKNPQREEKVEEVTVESSDE